jgi:hypothetical protein
MICLNVITKSPALSALFAGCLVLIYLAMMTYSVNLPPAMLCSVLVALGVYTIMGGKLVCSEPAQGYEPVPDYEPQATVKVPEGISSLATGHQDTNVGESVNTFRFF